MNKNLEKECFTQNYIIGADGELFRMAKFDLASTSLLSSSSSRSFGGCINGGLCVFKFFGAWQPLSNFNGCRRTPCTTSNGTPVLPSLCICWIKKPLKYFDFDFNQRGLNLNLLG